MELWLLAFPPQTQELQQSKEALEVERQRGQSLEADLLQAEQMAGRLQLELTETRQELQEALDLCGQHETLMEERNAELSTMQGEIR